MADHESAAASFKAHLQTLVSSTSAGALYDTDEEALAALEAQFRNQKTSTFDEDDLAQYLNTHWADLDDESDTDFDQADNAAEPEPLQWLRTHIPADAPAEAVAALLAESKRSDDDISSDLLDLIGFDAIESLPLILSRRQEIAATASLATSLNGLHIDTPIGARTPTIEETATAEQNNAQQKHRTRHRKNEKPKELKFALHAGMSIDELEQLHLQKLEEAANRPLIANPDGYVIEEATRYPHVYMNHAAAAAGSAFGSKVMLPIGTTKHEHEHYSEVSIPTPPKHPSAYTAKLLPISSLPELVRRSFPYKELNRLQSLVYPTAYETTENMLVCAPTGAGKTDVAVLTVLRAISMYADVRLTDGKMRNKEWKVVYVAPMKALASEIVVKMRKRFGWCGLAVRELTGDMQLTRQEIAETQMIVTTPEKWDVVTRKTTGEGELASRLRLLIIDEVHLLHEDRGAVLESIVARTLRQVESSQTLIRIVGLSATLPNYVDVADFLRVNPYKGLFFFDSSFRPVPLEQHFIASKGKPGSQTSKDNLDHATFEKALDLVKDGHQVLIFVHARKDTVKTAQMIKEKAIAEGEMEHFNGKDQPQFEGFRRELGMSRNREMKELVDVGLGIHHAGMLRTDRNISERLFEQNVTKILVCTATLAWGVNLPAYAVIIKGTQLYDSSKGQFMDLSILDVLQMFGRAGRPQYETHGVAYICTTNDKIDHYITAVNQQVPIESKFVEGLVDSLNAEISLGTVSTIDEGVRWLGYTFLHVRMRKNPLVYGLSAANLFSDPALGTRRRELIVNASKILLRNRMIHFDEDLETLVSTELGQIASRYYLRSASVEIFNTLFRSNMTEADLLALLSKSTEFQQVAVRDSEAEELKNLVENIIPCQVKGGSDTSDGKTNVLLQAYICRAALQDFALISDMAYVAQNAARIARSLQDIAMSNKWSQTTASLLSICKAIEKRLWPWCHPLEQMSLSSDLLHNIKQWADELTMEEILEFTAADFGKLIRLNERLGEVALNAARQFPRLSIKPLLQPLAHDLLRVRCEIRPDFQWNDKIHGKTEYFWIWLSDSEDLEILQIRKVTIKSNTVSSSCEFNIALVDKPELLHIRVMSDTWIGSESITEVPLKDLILPPPGPAKRKILDLAFPTPELDEDLKEVVRARSSPYSAFEVQSLHSLFFSQSNVLLSAPFSHSLPEVATVPIWRLIKKRPTSRTIIIANDRAGGHQIHATLSQYLSFAKAARPINISLAIGRRQGAVAGFGKPASRTGHTITVTTPRTILEYGRHHAGSTRILSPNFLEPDLILACDLHSLDADYELALAFLTESIDNNPRIIGFSAPLLDARSIARWLDVTNSHTFSFQSTSRPMPLTTSFTTFNLPQSAGLLKAMVRPAYEAMRANLGSTICFVPHRNHCYTILADLLTVSATDMNKLVEMDEELLAQYAMRISDPRIAEGVQHGFAVYTESMSPADQVIIRHLFSTRAIRALIASRDSCRSLDLGANLVIIMSTQYTTYDQQTDERHIIDYPIDDLLKMQAVVANHQERTGSSGQVMIFTQPDQASLISRFLNEGLPLESQLLRSKTLFAALLSAIADGTIASKQQCLDALATTFMECRLDVNPTYYTASEGTEDTQSFSSRNMTQAQRLSVLVDHMLENLRSQLLIRFQNENSTSLVITAFGKEVNGTRYTEEDLTTLFKLNETKALKVLNTLPGVKQLEEQVDARELSNFIGRLPRSIQRRINDNAEQTQSKKEKINGSTEKAPQSETSATVPAKATITSDVSAGSTITENGRDKHGDQIGKALLITFLSKKLPPVKSKLDIVQAKIAMIILRHVTDNNGTVVKK